MALSRRYTPEKPPEEVCNFGMDFSFIVPPGIGLLSGELSIWTNEVAPVPADADWVVGDVMVLDRALYCNLGGGVEGVDYQLRWKATDTSGNVWPRVALVLCAQTS